MAENIEEEVTDRVNPFSFQVFVKKKPSDGEEQQDKKGKKKKDKGASVSNDFIDIFSGDLPLSVERGRKSQKQKDSPSAADDEIKSNAENPFSFKKFLHKDTEHESSSRQTYTEDDNIDRGTLPDFCDEHFSTKTEEVDHSYDKRPVSSTTELLDVINNTNSDEDKPFQNSRSRKKKNELPDIFSDLNSLNDLDCASRTELITEVRKLRQTNKELRVDLYDAQKAAMKESKRVEKMLKEMKRAQQREVEDTKALEDMIHQVETNLELTTTRAVTSENIVVKLKQEVKTLKSQLAVITAEKKQLEQCGNTNTLMVQTAHNAAAKLIIGAGTAEQAISLLMSGVESLKLISETLTNIDRFSEANTSQGPQQSS